MQRRYLIAALALVFVVAAITPTLGSSSQTPRLVAKANFPARTAKQAKRIAKRAKVIARQARSAAAEAQTNANAAKTDAAEAKTTANNAQTTADSTANALAARRAVTDTEAGTVTTDEENAYVDLGGPSVTVTAPASGLVEVWAQAAVGDDGALSLFADGQQVPDQDPNGFCTDPPGSLLANPAGAGELTLATPGGPNVFGCGSLGPPSPVLFSASPGEHTYELRYADCGCDPGIDAEFSSRTLTVAPRP
jgi:hypothetical protein